MVSVLRCLWVAFARNGVGVLDPAEGFAAVVPGVDVDADRGLEVGHAGEGAAADCLAGEDAEEDLDQVHPGA